ncbi:hypothetical protein M2128_001569 [Polynucleobacter sphagniphilus]|uniref:hypothetical protein n=1 Tax=Polynucleobacter sphagniphilus TaxID=1743169 RepID=UPI002473DDBC|nr:hypothetical protein [Polynucleobacter sphagniphilus]MDH6302631.1 hypothetical protein [Polynucleobacter sphagniphilus]
MRFRVFSVLLLSIGSVAFAQTNDVKKPQMKFLGAYDAGQSNVSIIKLLDPADDVLCYVLMPDNATRKQVEKDKWVYESNAVGSISCLKVIVPVVAITPNAQQSSQKNK